MADREALQRQLAEKRHKLALLREQRNAAGSGEPAVPSAAPKGPLTSPTDAKAVDELLTELLGPTSPTRPTPPAQPATGAVVTPTSEPPASAETVQLPRCVFPLGSYLISLVRDRH